MKKENVSLRGVTRRSNLPKIAALHCITLATTFLFVIVTPTFADTNKALDYLRAQQDATGQITHGSTGDASPWAAIAFETQGIDPTTVRVNTTSLLDYLQENHPATTSGAIDIEKWILAITASNQNPYNFGGINYVSALDTYFTDNQLGNTNSENDDWFGVLALIASGTDKNDTILDDSLSFILAHQNTDGGFGYSTTAGSDGNDTAAAIQALVAAKNYGVTNTQLDTAINQAKTYLLKTQATTGGFLYDTNPWSTDADSDSTTWAMMALNVLDMQTSSEYASASAWLTMQQDTSGGFTACQYNAPDYLCQLLPNATTTAHALIALSGKGWLLHLFDPSSITPTATPSVSPTLTPTPTLTNTPTPTPTPQTTTTTTTTYTTTYITPTPGVTNQTPLVYTSTLLAPTPTDIPLPGVLGTQTLQLPEKVITTETQGFSFPSMFLGAGFAYLSMFGMELIKKFSLWK